MNSSAQAQYYNKLWSVQNLKSGLYAFCRGFADSLKFSDIFVLDSVDESKNYINEKNVKKGNAIYIWSTILMIGEKRHYLISKI